MEATAIITIRPNIKRQKKDKKLAKNIYLKIAKVCHN